MNLNRGFAVFVLLYENVSVSFYATHFSFCKIKYKHQDFHRKFVCRLCCARYRNELTHTINRRIPLLIWNEMRLYAYNVLN